MSAEKRRILDMLAQGKITVDEAEKLLTAVAEGQIPDDTGQGPASSTDKTGFKYLRVVVDPGPESEKGEKVNIRVPINLIRAGLKWAAFVPKHARSKVNEAFHEKGIDMDFERLTKEDVEELIVHLNDLTIEVEGKETVRVFCE
jgi:hypothetical protein